MSLRTAWASDRPDPGRGLPISWSPSRRRFFSSSLMEPRLRIAVARLEPLDSRGPPAANRDDEAGARRVGSIAMAVGATIHTFAVNLADVDRGIYEELSLRVARHPSETGGFML